MRPQYQIICDMCRAPFTATRIDARLCSARCRKRSERKPRRVELFVGGSRISGLTGDRCHSARYYPRYADKPDGRILLDSGAFSDKPESRLSFSGALERQLEWESVGAKLWGWENYHVDVLASYDFLMIDEVWDDGARRKKRWPADHGESAVDVSVKAAEYLANHRDELSPRTLLFGCQGVTPEQYIDCAKGILDVAQPQDWFGFGGRCILGRQPSLLQEHYLTSLEIVPLVAAKGLRHIHIFGVLYERAIAPLAWLCHQNGIELSTDSAAPALSVTRPDPKRAGVRAPGLQANVAWWHKHMSQINLSEWYVDPSSLLKRSAI